MIHREGKGSLQSFHLPVNRGRDRPFPLPLFHVGIHTVGRHFERPSIQPWRESGQIERRKEAGEFVGIYDARDDAWKR